MPIKKLVEEFRQWRRRGEAVGTQFCAWSLGTRRGRFCWRVQGLHRCPETKASHSSNSTTIYWVPTMCSQLKEISPEYSLEGLMLKLKLQYFCHLMQRTDSLEKKPDAGKDWRQKEKGMTEDGIVGCDHWLDGHEFESALGVGDGQGNLACCSPRGRAESDTIEWLNWTMCWALS